MLENIFDIKKINKTNTPPPTNKQTKIKANSWYQKEIYQKVNFVNRNV